MNNIENIIGSTIINICNGESGYQPSITIRTAKNEDFIITATPSAKFKIGAILDDFSPTSIPSEG